MPGSGAFIRYRGAIGSRLHVEDPRLKSDIMEV